LPCLALPCLAGLQAHPAKLIAFFRKLLGYQAPNKPPWF
jgi:hypothetical protein